MFQAVSDADTPIGLQAELGALRNTKLNLARDSAKLNELKTELRHRLADAVANLESQSRLPKTHQNRMVAADSQRTEMETAFAAGTLTADHLLDAGRQLSDAQVSYCQASVEREICHLRTQELTGDLLAELNVEIVGE